jgi:hypothetical protein
MNSFDRKKHYVKILAEDLNHNGFQYKEGLNVDTVPFNPVGSCSRGGLYFTTMQHMILYLNYGNKIADVEIPDDAEVYKDPSGNKWKADKIIIKNIREIKDLPQWQDENFCRDVMASYMDSYIVEALQVKSNVLKDLLIERYNDIRSDYVGYSKRIRDNNGKGWTSIALEEYKRRMKDLLSYIQLQN